MKNELPLSVHDLQNAKDFLEDVRKAFSSGDSVNVSSIGRAHKLKYYTDLKSALVKLGYVKRDGNSVKEVMVLSDIQPIHARKLLETTREIGVERARNQNAARSGKKPARVTVKQVPEYPMPAFVPERVGFLRRVLRAIW